jgi:chitin disaccharide deacetylase
VTKKKLAFNEISINADDFGYSIEINQAIVRCFQLGLIHRTSLMVNMPGFSDAISIIKSNQLISKNTGLHINITEGYPLSEPIKSCKQFCDNSGKFIYKRKKPVFFLKKYEKDALYQEMIAQMESFTSGGFKPSHLDSHHHIHTEWAVFKLMVRLGKAYSIRKIRLARNSGTQSGYLKTLYRFLLNGYLKYYANSAGSDSFGSLNDTGDLLSTIGYKRKLIEIMVHPRLDNNNDIIDSDQQHLQKTLAVIIPKYFNEK